MGHTTASITSPKFPASPADKKVMGSTKVGTDAHCRRVAAWCRELAIAAGLSESDRNLIEQAALSHHLPEILLNERGRSRLLADLRLEEGVGELIGDEVRELLKAFRGEAAASGRLVKLAALIEISDDFDQYFEAEPLLDTLESPVSTSVDAMMSYLQVTSRADVARVIDRLPVFPRAAREMVRCASDAGSDVRELERAAKLDQVLAGLLIQTANSAYYSPYRPIVAIPHAISYVGLDTARKVLLAAALRSGFATARQHKLWNHALDVAQSVEHLAQHSTLDIDPGEAFLAGLVHDVGCLAFSMMPPNFLDRFQRLTSRGCPPFEVEICLAGVCHGEAGAETLRQWKFGESTIEAVRWHHRPERSTGSLASLLYLGEFCCDSDEDLPSVVRLRAALERAGISEQVLAETGRRESCLDSLRFAAAA